MAGPGRPKKIYVAPSNIADLISDEDAALTRALTAIENLNNPDWVHNRIKFLEERAQVRQDKINVLRQVVDIAREDAPLAAQLHLSFEDALEDQQKYNESLAANVNAETGEVEEEEEGPHLIDQINNGPMATDENPSPEDQGLFRPPADASNGSNVLPFQQAEAGTQPTRRRRTAAGV